MKIAWAFIHFAILMIIFLCIFIGSVETKKLQKSFEEIFGDGWHLKEMGEEGEEKEEEAKLAQIMGQENEEQKGDEEHFKKINKRRVKSDEKLAIMRKYWEMKRNDPKMSDDKIANALKISGRSIRRWRGQFRGSEIFREFEMDVKSQLIVTDEQKRKIVREFLTIKERIKQQKRGKFSREQWNRMYRLLAKKLGTNHNKIYKWMSELGMGQEIRIKEIQMAIMRKYWEMKQNHPKMSDRKMAKALKIDRGSIRRWRGQFGEELGMEKQKNIVTEEQKRKIVHEFQTIKEIIKQKGWKYSHKQWIQIGILLAKKLGTNRTKIYEWISELGMGQRRTNEQIMTIMRKYWEMKQNDPKMSDKKIAKALKIGRESICKWKHNKLIKTIEKKKR